MWQHLLTRYGGTPDIWHREAPRCIASARQGTAAWERDYEVGSNSNRRILKKGDEMLVASQKVNASTDPVDRSFPFACLACIFTETIEFHKVRLVFSGSLALP